MRIKERKFHLFTELNWSEQAPDWKVLAEIGVVESRIEESGKIIFERRYYISSLTCVKIFAKNLRGLWGIENSLHWVLDVAFDEDACNRRKGNSPANIAVLRHIVLNLLKREKQRKVSTEKDV